MSMGEEYGRLSLRMHHREIVVCCLRYSDVSRGERVRNIRLDKSVKVTKAGVERRLVDYLPRIAQRLVSLVFGKTIILGRDELHVMI